MNTPLMLSAYEAHDVRKNLGGCEKTPPVGGYFAQGRGVFTP